MAKICRHYWLLAAPEGDLVLGRCRDCQAAREFPARLDETERGNDYQEIGRAPRYEVASLGERLAA